jgi:hypothetical protein
MIALVMAVDLVLHQASPATVAPGLAMRHEQAPAQQKTANEQPFEPEVHYRLNVGYGADSARATGDPAITQFSPKRTLFRSYMFGDAAFGAHGLPVASLDTYFAASYYYDFLGADPNSPFTTIYDRKDQDGRALLIRSAYAEIDPSSQGGTPLFVRAGRQFRLGAGIAHFDGLSLGYDNQNVEASAFVGQRVSLYVDERTGVVAGGALRAHALVGSHLVDAALETLTFEGDAYTNATVHASGVRGQGFVTARLFGASVSDLLGHAQYFLARHVSLLVDAQQKLGVAPIYDWIAGGEPSAAARSNWILGVDHWPLRYFTLPEPQPYTQVRVGVVFDPASAVEVLAYGSGHVVESSRPSNDPWPGRTGFDASWLEAGGMVDWRPGYGLSLLAGYQARVFDRPESATRLDDPANAGELRSQELIIDGRYSLGPRRLTTTAGYFLRSEDVQTPWLILRGNLRSGLRFDVESWLVHRVRLKASYEIADPSATLSPDVDTFQSVRVLAEAVF